MNCNLNTVIHNRFDFVLSDSKTGKVNQEISSYNIVLDQCYNRIVNGNNFVSYISIGTGTGELSPTRTGLFAPLDYRSVTFDSIDYFAEVPWSRWYVRYQPEELVGKTITEVGISYSSGNSALVTHSLLKDSEGNPISITKRDDEILTIYATIFAKISVDANSGIYMIERSPLLAPGAESMTPLNTLLRYMLQKDSTSYITSASPSITMRAHQGWPTNPDDPSKGYCSYFTAYSDTPGNTSRAISKSGVATRDLTNRTLTVEGLRFAVADVNQPIKAISCESAGFGIRIPSSAAPAQTFSDIPLTAADSTYQLFNCPAYDVDLSTLNVKVNGASVPFTTRGYSTWQLTMPEALIADYGIFRTGPHFGMGMVVCGLCLLDSNITAYRFDMANNTVTKSDVLARFSSDNCYIIAVVDDTIFFKQPCTPVGEDTSRDNIWRYTFGTDSIEAVVSDTSTYTINWLLPINRNFVGLFKSDYSNIDFYRYSSVTGTWSLDSTIETDKNLYWVNGGYSNTVANGFYYHAESDTVWFCKARSNNNVYTYPAFCYKYNAASATWTKIFELSNAVSADYRFMASPSGKHLFYVGIAWKDLNNGLGYKGYISYCRFSYDNSQWSVTSEHLALDGNVYHNSTSLDWHTFLPISDNEIIMGSSGAKRLYINEDGSHVVKETTLLPDAYMYGGRTCGVFMNDGTDDYVLLPDCRYLGVGWTGSKDTWYGNTFGKIMPNYIVDVILDTPVTSADSVTADFTSNCLNKTTNNVIDVAFTIKFGEGS